MTTIVTEDKDIYLYDDLDEDFSNTLDVLRCLLHPRHYAIVNEIEKLYGLSKRIKHG